MARRRKQTVATQGSFDGDAAEIQVSHVVLDDDGEPVQVAQSLQDAWKAAWEYQKITRQIATGHAGICPICGGRSIRVTCGDRLCGEMWVLGHLTRDGEARWLMLPEGHRLNKRWPRMRDKILAKREREMEAEGEMVIADA